MNDTNTEAATRVNPQVILDQALLDQKLAALKGLDLSSAEVCMYVVKSVSRNTNKRFSGVCRLACSDDMKSSLRGYVLSCIAGNEHITALKEINTTQDNRFFHVESSATDFPQAVNAIQNDAPILITASEQLSKFNGYVIQLIFNQGRENHSLFAYHYIAGSWSTKNSCNKRFSFNSEMVATIDSAPEFRITSGIDLIQFGEDIFVSDIGKFETAMNYTERLADKKGEAITALCASNAVSAVYKDTLTQAVGKDKFLMRQLASVHSKSFFSNDIWMRKLKKAADKASEDGNPWQVRFDDNNQLIVEDDKSYIRELLTLLQNKRVKTVVDEVVCDVDGELIALG
ncbi:Kiwa anti-phage protein KwaB-like domain-containing protein [Vibrio cyclitrophicus]